MTGEALRRLLGFADRDGLREAVIAALGRTRTVTARPQAGPGPPGGRPVAPLVAEAPTTEGVIAALQNEPLRGRRWA